MGTLEIAEEVRFMRTVHCSLRATLPCLGSDGHPGDFRSHNLSMHNCTHMSQVHGVSIFMISARENGPSPCYLVLLSWSPEEALAFCCSWIGSNVNLDYKKCWRFFWMAQWRIWLLPGLIILRSRVRIRVLLQFFHTEACLWKLAGGLCSV